MTNVHDFTKARLQKLAIDFVDVYEEAGGGIEGELAAGEWATTHIQEFQFEDFRPYVHKVFNERGYELTEYMYD